MNWLTPVTGVTDQNSRTPARTPCRAVILSLRRDLRELNWLLLEAEDHTRHQEAKKKHQQGQRRVISPRATGRARKMMRVFTGRPVSRRLPHDGEIVGKNRVMVMCHALPEAPDGQGLPDRARQFSGR